MKFTRIELLNHMGQLRLMEIKDLHRKKVEGSYACILKEAWETREGSEGLEYNPSILYSGMQNGTMSPITL